MFGVGKISSAFALEGLNVGKKGYLTLEDDTFKIYFLNSFHSKKKKGKN